MTTALSRQATGADVLVAERADVFKPTEFGVSTQLEALREATESDLADQLPGPGAVTAETLMIDT